MSTRYEVNEFEEVVPYHNGRMANDTNSYRELTDYERQLLYEIKDHESDFAQLQKEREEYRKATGRLNEQVCRLAKERDIAVEALEEISNQSTSTWHKIIVNKALKEIREK